jgi:hypothetical protein
VSITANGLGPSHPVPQRWPVFEKILLDRFIEFDLALLQTLIHHAFNRRSGIDHDTSSQASNADPTASAPPLASCMFGQVAKRSELFFVQIKPSVA